MTPPWDPARDSTLICAGIRQESADVRTIVLEAPEPRQFNFLPGQFMTLELEAAGLQRCYTIASPPTRPFRLEITVKRGGPGSAWLHDVFRPGARLRVSGPFGEFSFGTAPRGKYLFLGAGSGITPLMSMARTAHDLGGATDIVLMQNARSEADVLFAGELSAMSTRAGFRHVAVVERDGPGWAGFRGRIAGPMLAAAVPDLVEREVYCCGPAPYMAAARALLDEAGFDRRRYHEESFDFAAAEPEPIAVESTAADAAEGFQIVFSQSGRTLRCGREMTVLNAARAAGLRLPSACGKGVCGTCKSRVIAGTIEMRHGGGIRPREIEAGMALLCCARPTSDLVVDR